MITKSPSSENSEHSRLSCWPPKTVSCMECSNVKKVSNATDRTLLEYGVPSGR